MMNPTVKSIWNPPHLSAQIQAPFETRISMEKPHLSDSLFYLKKELGEASFDKYINPIHNITKSGETLLITTGNEMLRTQIERNCIGTLKKAFAVQRVRVVSCR